MRFRLLYDGELRSRNRESRGTQVRLANHKQDIRRQLHPQLRELWQTHGFLANAKVWPEDYRINRAAFEGTWAFEPDQKAHLPLVQVVAQVHENIGYKFVPLVRRDWKLQCSLHILFLRRDPPGEVVRAGDLDNRIKTLIDGLRMPHSLNELGDYGAPTDDQHPFFCLLEDDDLISGMSVESERLLIPPRNKSDEVRSEVRAVITVDVKPYEVTTFNLSFSA